MSHSDSEEAVVECSGFESLHHCAQEMALDVNEPFGSQQFHSRPQSLLVPHMQFKWS